MAGLLYTPDTSTTLNVFLYTKSDLGKVGAGAFLAAGGFKITEAARHNRAAKLQTFSIRFDQGMVLGQTQ